MKKQFYKLRILSFTLVILIVAITLGCNNYQDAGLIKWSFNNETLEWKAVSDAKYYKIIFYEDNLVTPVNILNYHLYAYDSNFSFFNFPENEYYLKILVFYEDGNYEESEIINFSLQRDFQHVHSIGSNYLGTSVSWSEVSSKQSDSNFQDYTIRINEEEINIDENEYSLADYEAGIYKIQVRVNYEEGVSSWSKPFYAFYKITLETIQVYYDIASGENFSYSYPKDEEVVAVIGDYNIDFNDELPNQIVNINGSNFEVNKYYIENEGNTEEVEHLQIIISFMIITDKSLYLMNLTNMPITNY